MARSAGSLRVPAWLPWIVGLALACPLAAHRLDEYLQATLISLQADRVTLEVNLTPGVAVFEAVLASIDTNHDGHISALERQSYANRVLGDVALEVDLHSQHVAIVESQFPSVEDMRAGLGTIRLILRSEPEALPPGRHQLHFQNRHQAGIGAYLVNALVPPGGIRIERQSRDNRQTEIRIDYLLTADPKESTAIGDADNPRWVVVAGLSLMALLGYLWQRYSRAR